MAQRFCEAPCPQSHVLSHSREWRGEYQPFARVAAGFAWYGIGIQYSKPHVHASGVVSWRLSRKLATRAERTIDPAQPMTTHGHAGVCECPAGHGTVLTTPAKAVSIDSQATGRVPHGKAGAALIGLSGTIDGAKKNVAPINMMLTILRRFIFAPEPGCPLSLQSYCHQSFPKHINPSHVLSASPGTAAESSTTSRRSRLPGLSAGGCRGS